jgi:hypothetical protein
MIFLAYYYGYEDTWYDAIPYHVSALTSDTCGRVFACLCVKDVRHERQSWFSDCSVAVALGVLHGINH